jgi:hypothetical protein
MHSYLYLHIPANSNLDIVENKTLHLMDDEES